MEHRVYMSLGQSLYTEWTKIVRTLSSLLILSQLLLNGVTKLKSCTGFHTHVQSQASSLH